MFMRGKVSLIGQTMCTENVFPESETSPHFMIKPARLAILVCVLQAIMNGMVKSSTISLMLVWSFHLSIQT